MTRTDRRKEIIHVATGGLDCGRNAWREYIFHM